jgi:hypothetical protein
MAVKTSGKLRGLGMTPVRDLHRTRGSFSKEAANSVMAVPGPLARLVPLAASTAAGLSVGILLTAMRRTP